MAASGSAALDIQLGTGIRDTGTASGSLSHFFGGASPRSSAMLAGSSMLPPPWPPRSPARRATTSRLDFGMPPRHAVRGKGLAQTSGSFPATTHDRRAMQRRQPVRRPRPLRISPPRRLFDRADHEPDREENQRHPYDPHACSRKSCCCIRLRMQERHRAPDRHAAVRRRPKHAQPPARFQWVSQGRAEQQARRDAIARCDASAGKPPSSHSCPARSTATSTVRLRTVPHVTSFPARLHRSILT